MEKTDDVELWTVVGDVKSKCIARKSKEHVGRVESTLQHNTTQQVTHLSCGGFFSAVVLEHRYVYTAGHNNFGQCCRRCSDSLLFGLIQDDENHVQSQLVEQLICGPAHMTIFTRHKRLYFVGSNLEGRMYI